MHDVRGGDIETGLTALLQQRADCPCRRSVQSIDDGARQVEQDVHAELVTSGNQRGRASECPAGDDQHDVLLGRRSTEQLGHLRESTILGQAKSHRVGDVVNHAPHSAPPHGITCLVEELRREIHRLQFAAHG
jgi:hypothetical protein